MRRDGIRLGPRLQTWLYGTFAVLFASGLAWWLLHRFGRTEGDSDLQSSPLEPWLLKLHGAAAMVSLIVLGTLIPLHMRRGWRARRNRGSGGGMVALCLGLILTGYALYYAGGEGFRALASTVHITLGLAFPTAIVWHIVRGRRTRQRGPGKFPKPSRH